MTALARLTRSVGPPLPGRDLVFLDALAATLALFVAYAARAATKASYPLSWAGVWPYVRHALPLTIAALLLSAAALGLYGARAAAAGFWQQAAAVLYAAVPVAAIGVYYGGPYPPTLVILPAVVIGAAALFGLRRIYWMSLDSSATESPTATRPGSTVDP